jgi:hypothetical protein
VRTPLGELMGELHDARDAYDQLTECGVIDPKYGAHLPFLERHIQSLEEQIDAHPDAASGRWKSWKWRG